MGRILIRAAETVWWFGELVGVVFRAVGESVRIVAKRP